MVHAVLSDEVRVQAVEPCCEVAGSPPLPQSDRGGLSTGYLEKRETLVPEQCAEHLSAFPPLWLVPACLTLLSFNQSLLALLANMIDGAR
jgi:hypothetical protein